MNKRKSLTIIGLAAASILPAHATSILTTADFNGGSFTSNSDGVEQVLSSVTIGGLVTSDIQFAGGTPTGNQQIVHNTGGTTAPATKEAALTDNRIDTGVMTVGVDDVYTLSGLTTDDVIIVFFNGSTNASFFDAPAQILALDGGGSAVGSAIDLPSMTASDNFGTLNLDRVGSSTLNNRGMYGFLVDVADFGGTVGDIAGVQFAGANPGVLPDNPDSNAANIDFHLVAAATGVPEPSTALLGSFAALFLIRRRR